MKISILALFLCIACGGPLEWEQSTLDDNLYPINDDEIETLDEDHFDPPTEK